MARIVTLVALTLMLGIVGSPVTAQVIVGFEEDAPADRITLINYTACDLVDFDLEIDLRGSAGALIFDVTEAGAGFNAYQPFGIAEGAESVVFGTQVLDGDQSVRISFSHLASGSFSPPIWMTR